MGEQRFKVGDWVRSLVNWGDIEAGKIYQIPHLDGDGEPWFTPDGTGGWSDYLTLDEIEPWQPRVGERVRIVNPRHDFKRGHKGREFTVDEQHGSYDGEPAFVGYPESRPYIWTASELEPVASAVTTPEKTATIKIVADKFYKTRDGRKVGPAFIFGNIATFGNAGNYASAVWSDDGRSSSRDDKLSLKDNDIIAEWIDEPVAKASNDNAKPKFKVGDIVTPSHGWSKDNATVTQIKDGRVSVRWNNVASGSENGWREDELSPVLPRPTTTIVALIEDGQPKPSSTPHVHTSAAAAEKEAKRLAAKYKGQQFGVFTLTTTHEEAAPVYDHKWQNMAALGLKIDAIKELRAVAGLDLLSAKRAVEAFENAA